MTNVKVDNMKWYINKKRILLIPVVMLIAATVVVILAWSALRPVSEKSGFNRQWMIGQPRLLQVVQKPEGLVGLAGATSTSLYFYTTDPSRLLVTDFLLEKETRLTLNIPNNDAISSKFNSVVDSPSIYLFAGNLPGIFKTSLTDSAVIGYRFPGALFTRSAIISDHSFAIRAFEGINQIFIKGNPSTGQFISENNISEKTDDAGISTDGKLMYCRDNALLLYVHYYRNEILCLDTNLQLVKKIYTIDRSSKSLAKGEVVKSISTVTTLSPKRMLNVTAALWKGMLLNYSKVKADNETLEVFEDNSVIDIYDIGSGLYKASFYISNYKKEHVKNFYIVGDRLIMTTKNYLLFYEMPSI